MTKNLLLAPVLKWVGGKRQLLNEILPLIPNKISTYVEPFVGGGALIFSLQPGKAIINDSNEELINVYRVIKDKPDKLIELLHSYELRNNEDFFYQVRAVDRDKAEYVNLTELERAARIIYLNKTCYNGLFRVNMAGEFNTPYGNYKKPNIVNQTVIKALSNYFNKYDVRLICGDYKAALTGLRKGSFVYLDPPYMPLSATSSYTGYTAEGFGLAQQDELKEQCDILNKKGIRFLLSNSSHPYIHDLYNEYDIKIVSARRAINSKGNKRGEIDEVLIKNYE